MPLPKTKSMKSVKGDIPVPIVGFGTWASGDTGWCHDATLQALKAGYRHIDCAWHYGVDEEVGAAIRESKIPRSEIFITTKFWPEFGAPENVEKCLDICLKNMGLEYVDLYLAHWPLAFKALPNIATAHASPSATNDDRGIAADDDGKPIIDWAHTSESMARENGQKGSFKPTWRAMQRLVSEGKVRAIGVSNFNITQLQEILSADGEVPLSCNQVESHPWFPNTELFDFMMDKGILGTAYCPFAGQKGKDGINLVQDPSVKALAEKNQLGVGQLLQSWAVQRGTIPLGKSQNAERIAANLDVRELSQEDFEALDKMDRGPDGRTCDLGPRWGVKVF